MKNVHVILLVVIILGSILRLYNLNWDQGHSLHPDERLYFHELHAPASWEEFFSPDSPLNPKMFFYGPFPLYIYNFFYSLGSGASFLITSRTIAALFSIATIPLLYLLGKKIASSKVGLWAAFIFAVTPTSIQHAHFNTTESYLVFFLSLIMYLSIKLVQTKRLRLIPALAIFISFAFATKITALTFGIIPAVALIYLLFTTKKYASILSVSAISALLAISVILVLTPYYWIDFATFWQQQTYMQGVILGTNKPPFVIIYEGTLPYLYPLVRILPFSFGFILTPLALIGGGIFTTMFVRDIFDKHGKRLTKLFPKIHGRNEAITIAGILILFPLIYFLWAGSWYSKFSRYFILLLPFFAFYAAVVINKLHFSLRTIIAVFLVVNGALFFRLYFSTHTRIAASEWIYQNTPPSATIAFEHWDDPLPLPMSTYESRHGSLKELQVYNEPDTPAKIATLADTLAQSDYIALSSRRVYASILLNKAKYPLTSALYEQLFAENLGFKLEKKFTNYPYFFSDDSADESFQSYDHPTVHLFRKYETLSASEIQGRIEGNATR